MMAYTIACQRPGHVVRVESDGIGCYVYYPSGNKANCIRGALNVHESLVIAAGRDASSVPFAASVMEAGSAVFTRGASVAAWRLP